MEHPMLETFIAYKRVMVAQWAASRWPMGVAPEEGFDWWCVKASRGNGGRDVWVMHPGNVDEVNEELTLLLILIMPHDVSIC